MQNSEEKKQQEKLLSRLADEIAYMKNTKSEFVKQKSQLVYGSVSAASLQAKIDMLDKMSERLEDILHEIVPKQEIPTKLSYEIIDRDTLWVAKMNGYRKIGTYNELTDYRESEECRDFDICSRQPEHLKEFYDAYFAYETEHGFTFLKDFYEQVYNPTTTVQKEENTQDIAVKKKDFYSALEIAKCVITICTEQNVSVSNVVLNKLLYLIQEDFLLHTGEPLFEEDFVAMKFGPCVPIVYWEFAGYGAMPIKRTYETFLDDNKTRISQIAIANAALMPWEGDMKRIIANSSPWANSFERGFGKISKDDICDFAKEHTANERER